MAVHRRMASMGASRDSTGVLPQQKLKPKLMVLWAFDRGEDGELHPAFEAREMPDGERLARHESCRISTAGLLPGVERPTQPRATTARARSCSSTAPSPIWTDPPAKWSGRSAGRGSG